MENQPMSKIVLKSTIALVLMIPALLAGVALGVALGVACVLLVIAAFAYANGGSIWSDTYGMVLIIPTILGLVASIVMLVKAVNVIEKLWFKRLWEYHKVDSIEAM
jgi:hypothetical protein